MNMAKAKFPGKPSKTSQITRFRFSSRNISLTSDPSKLTVKQLTSGLLLFQETFGFTDEEEEDLHGFEKVGNTFTPCHSFKGVKQCQQNNVLEENSQRRSDYSVNFQVNQVFITSTDRQNFTVSKNLKVQTSLQSENYESNPNESDKTESSLNKDKIKRTYTVSHSSLQNGIVGSDSRLAKKLLDKAKSPKKFVLPSVSVHSSRPIIPNKRFLEDMVSLRKRKQIDAQGMLHKPHERKLQKSIKSYQTNEIGKERIKREIERYTDIMTTEIADQKHKGDELKRNIIPKSDKGKEGKLREKIQQLLRSQWESRLQLVDGKNEIPVNRKESPQVQDSTSSLSSEDDQPVCKNRRITSNYGNCNNTMKSKIILRKARLQVNQKLLKQLRQPSRLQQLVTQKSEPVEPDTAPEKSKSPILRPAQLIIQKPTTPLRTQSPTTATLKEIPDTLPLPSPAVLNCRLSSFQPAGEAGVSNPLGCAFVMEPSDTKGLPGTVVCGVCGAVRRYSFILQARKFGTFSCEPCRKFISRVLRARVSVKCSSGTGRCIHPPVLRWNSACPPEDKPISGEVMTTRCKACWLKLALTGFRMRETDHDDLRSLLPKDMQELVPTASNRLENLPWAPNRGQIIRMKNNPAIVSQLSSSSHTVTAAEAVLQQELRIENHDPAISEMTVNSSSKTSKAEHCAGSRTRKKSESNHHVASRRSSLEIKGPRVKNVCRSAMLALGQPRAKFVNEDVADSQHIKKSDGTCACCLTSDSSSLVPATSKCSPRQLTEHSCTGASNLIDSTRTLPANRSSNQKNLLSSPARPLTIVQGERIPETLHDANIFVQRVQNRVGLITPAIQAWHQRENLNKKNSIETPDITKRTTKSVARRKLEAVDDSLFINIWESYDTDRVWQQGFALIGSNLPSYPLCYLCGSAGRNELVYCLTCCNPFHLFCVTDSLRGALRTKSVEPLCRHWKKILSVTLPENKSSDLGSQCASIGNELSNCDEDRRPPPIDSILIENSSGFPEVISCRLCKKISKNKDLCSACAERQEHIQATGCITWDPKRKSTWSCFNCTLSEICPICEKQHNWQTEKNRLLCTCCRAWIHASCEQLPDEERQILSKMTSIEYVCRLCNSEQKWFETLRQQVVHTFSNIFKNLIEQNALEQEAINQATKDLKVELLTCADFCQFVRRLSSNADVAEAVLSASMVSLNYNTSTTQSTTQFNTDFRRSEIEYDLGSDSRKCSMCQTRGEGSALAEGRLIYCSNDEWVHINCILWSNEVEEVGEALQNVFVALARSRNSRCGICQHKGATLSCCTQGCTMSFHFPCAMKDMGITMFKDKRILCLEHANRVTMKNSDIQRNFEVSRCVYVDLEAEAKRLASRPLKEITIAIGSLQITSLGHSCVDVFGNDDLLVPVGFQCHRKYWSVKEPWKLVTYKCRILYVPDTPDGVAARLNATVSHDDDDAIMVESGLNLTELDSQDDRDLIHMVLKDADFEQELKGGAVQPFAATNNLSDFSFGSDVNLTEETSSPTDEHALSLEAWLADPEHAVILLDSAILASLEIDPGKPPVSIHAADFPSKNSNTSDHQPPEAATAFTTFPPSNKRRKRCNTYTQWREMKMQPRNLKSLISTTRDPTGKVQSGRSPNLDMNGNESELSPGNSNVVASIKVSSFGTDLSPVNSFWTKPSANILQLDGAADSSENEGENDSHLKSLQKKEVEPVKCRRCRRSYKTWHSFSKHVEVCVELLSSGGSSNSSTNEDDSDVEIHSPILPKVESTEVLNPVDLHLTGYNSAQVPVVNSSSLVPHVPIASPSECSPTSGPAPHFVGTMKCVKPVVQRRCKPNMSRASYRPLAARIVNTTTQQHCIPPVLTLQPSLYITSQLDVNSMIPTTIPYRQQQQQIFIVSPSQSSFPSASLEANSFPTPTLPHITPLVSQAAPSGTVLQIGAISPNVVFNFNQPGVSPYSTLIHEQPFIRLDSQTCNQFIYLEQQQPQLMLSSLPAVISIPQNFTTMQIPHQPPCIIDVAPPCTLNSTEIMGRDTGNISTDILTKTTSAPFVTNIENRGHPISSDDTQSTIEEKSGCINSSVRNRAALTSIGACTILSAKNLSKIEEISTNSTLSATCLNNDILPPANVDSNREAKERVQLQYQLQNSSCSLLPDALMSESPAKAESPYNRISSASILSDSQTNKTWHKETRTRHLDNCQKMIDTAIESTTPIPTPPQSPLLLQLPFDNVSSSADPDIMASKDRNENSKQGKNGFENQKLAKNSRIVFELMSDDGYYTKSESLSDVKKDLLGAVQDARIANNMKPLSSFDSCSQWNLIGLNHNTVRYLLEQLPNSNRCQSYTFKYHKPPKETECHQTVTPLGCARLIPYQRRTRCDTLNWLASQHRNAPQPFLTCASDIDGTQPNNVRRATTLEMQPISVRYKNLSRSVQRSVGVYRSNIHGKGLFCKREIEAGEMVVEYTGEVIRSVLCDKREKDYEAKKMGCYMFRIDEHTIVDATMHGNCARFINHSCEPNCYSRIVDIWGVKHILIFALRKILRGEELTYDYKFPIEDVKIPCTCGSHKCRKYLN